MPRVAIYSEPMRVWFLDPVLLDGEEGTEVPEEIVSKYIALEEAWTELQNKLSALDEVPC